MFVLHVNNAMRLERCAGKGRGKYGKSKSEICRKCRTEEKEPARFMDTSEAT